MQQATRLAVAIVGSTVTLLGVVMLVTPGPGWLMILLGLGVLGVEFVWARRLLRRLKKGAAELACSVFADAPQRVFETLARTKARPAWLKRRVAILNRKGSGRQARRRA